MSDARRKPSLQQRLQHHVLLPLALTWLVGTLVALATAQHFAQRAFDRSLLDDAYLLASSTRKNEDGQLQLSLTPRELKAVLFGQGETTYFSLRTADGSLVAGHAALQMPPAQGDALYRLGEVQLEGQLLRAVSIERDEPQPFTVVVAQTTRSRNALLRQLIRDSLLPQALFLVLLAAWLRRSIARDVLPLSKLEEAVGNRDTDDLQPVRVEATTHDVAGLADAINALLIRLGHSLRAQGEFSGNVAHELRTPLAGIRALASYGLSHGDPQVWREQLEAIAASEARASRLVDKLLALAVAAEAEVRLRLRPVRLDDLARQAVLRHLPRADAAGVDLGARGIEHPVEVQGDPTLIEGILDNLLDNALRYGLATSGAPPAITVSVETTPQAIALDVQDNGPGHPDLQQEQLVARGAQGETGLLLGQGAGLGLALVAQYARLMNARLELGRGPDGHGWHCRVLFPVRPHGA